MSSPVIDLSHWNPTPDWAQIRNAGVVGVIHKATESTGYTDPMLFARAKAAMDAGLKWSTYHFLRPGSMSGQMRFYLGVVKPKPGERVCLDHEDAGVSIGQLEEAVQILQADPRDLQVCVYSGHLIRNQLADGHSAILATTSLWIAHYTGAPEPAWPDGTWPMWSLWQWTDKEVIDGIDTPVDGDRWSGTREALLEWFGPAESQPVPEPVRKPLEIFIPEGVPYRIVAGDKVYAG